MGFFTAIKFGFGRCTKGTEGEKQLGPNLLADDGSSHLPAAKSTRSMSERAEQLAKIKGLLATGAVSQDEFDRMKADVLAS
jgi:hypothetical protein